ncbi:MAG: OB-fold domain-containing protein [Dehalococcoidia bacterium]
MRHARDSSDGAKEDAMPEYKGMNLIMPKGDRENRPYFEAARQGRLTPRRCGDCGLLRYLPGSGCPYCSSLASDWVEVSGRGTIHSYEIVTQAIQPGFADWVPYAVVLVELDEQRGVPSADEAIRIIANLVTPDFRPEDQAKCGIGLRVRAVFQPGRRGGPAPVHPHR